MSDHGVDPGRPGRDRFRTTRWTLVLAAGRRQSAEAGEALGELCSLYWYPLYAFVRRKGYGEHDAADLVQGFFAGLLSRGDLASMDPSRGRFRSFLMASCSHYLSNRADHDRAKKRGGGKAAVSFDQSEAEGRYAREPSHGMTAERLFERRWALTLLDLVMERLEFDMARSGKSRLFEALRPSLVGGGEKVPYAEVAAGLGISEEAARVAAHRLRKKYRELLRDEVGRTLEDPSGVDEEIRALFAALAD